MRRDLGLALAPNRPANHSVWDKRIVSLLTLLRELLVAKLRPACEFRCSSCGQSGTQSANVPASELASRINPLQSAELDGSESPVRPRGFGGIA